MGENHEGKKGELLPRQKYAELLTSSSQAVIIVARLRRNIQHGIYLGLCFVARLSQTYLVTLDMSKFLA
jgi:hypothetical protein